MTGPLVVRRATLRTWLVTLAAVPAVVLGVDILYQNRLINVLREVVFGEEPDQSLTTTDTLWAWAMVAAGALVVAWGLKELFAPTTVVTADDDGLRLKVSGPFRPPTLLPWGSLHDVRAGSIEDDEDLLEVLVIEVVHPEVLPANPWGGRRLDDHTLALVAVDWDYPPEHVAAAIVDRAMARARAADLEPG